MTTFSTLPVHHEACTPGDVQTSLVMARSIPFYERAGFTPSRLYWRDFDG
jgi:hypothetical protein